MSKLTFINLVSASDAETFGVQALADRPNLGSAYGEGGLSAGALKLRFDQFATMLATAINELQTVLNGEDATKYIPFVFTDEEGKVTLKGTLSDLIGYITSGDLAKEYLKMPKEAASTEMLPIASVIHKIQKDLANFTTDYKDIIEYLKSVDYAEKEEF